MKHLYLLSCYILSCAAIFVSCYSCSHREPQGKADGPGTIRLTVHEGTNMAAALSPDKREFALDIQGTIWIMPADGGKAVAITDEMGDCHEPAWSPDGEYIAFHSYRTGNYHIWTLRKDGSGLRQITEGMYDDREPCWTPDGKAIVFSSDRNGNYDLWKTDLETGRLTALTTDSVNEYGPAISADGKKIAFVSEGEKPGIALLENGVKSLAIPPGTYSKLAAPCWSPDDKHLSFVAYNKGISVQLVMADMDHQTTQPVTPPEEDVFPFRVSWVTDHTFYYTSNGKIQKKALGGGSDGTIPLEAELVLNRSSYKRKTYDFDDRQERVPLGIIGPAVSPDGQQVAFAALGDLYVQSIGGKASRLTKDPSVEADPDWSPDGRTLAYVSDHDGPMGLWLYDLRKAKSRKLALDSAGIVSRPCWSPDGKKIAYYFRDDRMAWGRWSLQVIDVSSGAAKTVYPSVFFPGKPSWSPRGDLIALMAENPSSTRYREGTNQFLLVSLTGKPSKFVSPDTAGDPGMRAANGPVWSPDGKQMAYIRDGLLWTVGVDESGAIRGAPRQITRELADKPSWTGDSKQIVYLHIDRLKKADLGSGKTEEIALDLTWKPMIATGKYIIHAGKIFNGVDRAYQTDMDILIENNRISHITPHRDQHEIAVIDASDKVVMPGLFESHTHQHISDGEELGKIWLSYGITSVRETGSDPYDALERKEAWASGARPGPREFFTGPLMDGSRVYYGLSSSVTDSLHLKMEFERIGKLGYDLVKTYVRMPDSLQKEIVTAAHAMGIPVSSHELYPAAAFNVDAVEHLAGTSRRGYSQRQSGLHKIYDDAMRLTARSGMNVTPTIVMGGFLKMVHENKRLPENRQYQAFYSRRYMNSWVNRAAAANYGFMDDYQQAVLTIIQLGGRITAGTDSPQVPYGTSLHAELWLFVQAGLSPYQALQNATINAARAVGVDKDLGSLEAGKLADLVIVSGDPLRDISDAWNVQTVIKGGIKYEINELLPSK